MTTKLEKIRLSRGLSQNRLSELSGVHQQTISLIEKGKPIQSLRQVQKLASALNCNPSDLIEVDSGYDKMTAQELKISTSFCRQLLSLPEPMLEQRRVCLE